MVIPWFYHHLPWIYHRNPWYYHEQNRMGTPFHPRELSVTLWSRPLWDHVSFGLWHQYSHAVCVHLWLLSCVDVVRPLTCLACHDMNSFPTQEVGGPFPFLGIYLGSGHHRDEVLVPWIWWYDRASEAQRMCTCWLAPIIMYFGEYRASEVRVVPMLTATSWWCVTCIHGYWFFTMYIIYLSNPWPPPNLYITTW